VSHAPLAKTPGVTAGIESALIAARYARDGQMRNTIASQRIPGAWKIVRHLRNVLEDIDNTPNVLRKPEMSPGHGGLSAPCRPPGPVVRPSSGNAASRSLS
jgi:hypothetical protein